MPRPLDHSTPLRWHMIEEVDLVPLIAEHRRWCALAKRLERIADALPTLPSVIERAALRAQLRQTFADPEHGPAFPMEPLFARESVRPPIELLLDRLAKRRLALTIQAQDLIDMLGEPAERIRPETLGFMLRCTFGGANDTIALELLAMLLIAPERLTQDARDFLLERLEDVELPGL